MGDPIDEIDYDNPPFPLTAIDKRVVATRDEDYHRITWEELTEIIANNRLELLKRVPSSLRRYLAWSHATKQHYGNMSNFVMRERLGWEPDSPAGASPTFAHHSDIPFADHRDYAVLPNDWPYGIEHRILHLLVWTKTRIAVDDVNGDVTDESRKLIEDFVTRFFASELGQEGRARVLWFKNWVSLQSVRGVDHVHVLVKDAPEEIVKMWTKRRDA